MNQPVEPPRRTRAWTITGMLVLFMIINFGDKAVLGLAAVPMMKGLGISPASYGLLSSSFYFLFSAAALLIGFLTNRASAKWIIFAMAVVWSLSQLPIVASAAGFGTLLATRVLLGGSEGPATPISNHAAHKWFADRDRSIVSGLIGVGPPLGVVLASPVLSWVIVAHGWRLAFGVTGAIGLVWALAWIIIGKEGPIRDTLTPAAPEASQSLPTWRILFTGTWLSSVAGSFAAFWSVTVLVAWVPPYFTKVLGYPTQVTGSLVIVPWAIQAVGIFGAGLLSQRMLRRGVSSRRARGLLGGAVVIFAGAAVLVSLVVGGGWLKIVLVGLGFGLGAVIIPIGQTTSAEICPVSRRGGVLGTYAAIYSVAGVIAPALTGVLVGAYVRPATGYAVAFTVTGVLLVVCGVLATCFVRPERDRQRLAGLVQIMDTEKRPPVVLS